MAEIEVDPDQVTAVGNAIVGTAEQVGQIGQPLGALGGATSRPSGRPAANISAASCGRWASLPRARASCTARPTRTSSR
jgi:hypothetical protein